MPIRSDFSEMAMLVERRREGECGAQRRGRRDTFSQGGMRTNRPLVPSGCSRASQAHLALPLVEGKQSSSGGSCRRRLLRPIPIVVQILSCPVNVGTFEFKK